MRQGTGYMNGLSEHFTVASIDSLGHGLSEKPPELELYHESSRAADVVSVMDDLGFEKAHVIGFSMGGWMSVAVAKYYSDRLASLIVFGWDHIDGRFSARGPNAVLDFEVYMNGFKQGAPAIYESLKGEFVESALAPCFYALGDIEGHREAVENLEVPILFCAGVDDEYHPIMQRQAEAAGYPFVSGPGDHVGAFLQGTDAILGQMRDFLLSASAES